MDTQSTYKPLQDYLVSQGTIKQGDNFSMSMLNDLATKNGITGYTGTDDQNKALASKLNTPPVSTTTATSAFGSGSNVTKQGQLDNAMTSAAKIANPIVPAPTTPTSTPSTSSATPAVLLPNGDVNIQALTPTSALTEQQYNKVVQQTGNNSSGWVKNADGTYSPSQYATTNGVNGLDTIKSQNLLDSYITPKLTSLPGVKATTDSDGSISITNSQGTQTRIDPGLIAGLSSSDPTIRNDSLKGIDQSINAVSTFENTVATAKKTADTNVSKLDADKAIQQAALDKEHSAAISSAKAAMAAANPYGMPNSGDDQYITSIDDAFKVKQAALDKAYLDAKTQTTSAGDAATSKAYNDLNSTVSGILDQAQTTATGRKTFAFNVQQKAMADFTNLASKFDTSSLPQGKELSSLNVDSNGKTGIPSIDAIIAQGVQGGLSPEAALTLVQGQTLAQNKSDQTTFLGNLKQFNLPDMSNMTLAQAQQDPLLASVITQGSRVFGSPEAGFRAMQQSYAQQKQTLDLQKENMDIQRASASAQQSLANLQIKAMTAGANIMRSQVVTATKANTPLGNLINAAGTASDVDAIGKTLTQAKADLNSKDPAVRAKASSDIQANTAKLFDISARMFTGRSVTQGQIKLEEAAQSFPDSLKAKALSFAGKGTSIASPAYTSALYDAVHDVMVDKASNQVALDQYKKLQDTAKDLKTQYPAAAPEIDGYVPQIDSFISTYGKGSTASNAVNVPQYEGYEYRDGKYYPTK